MRKTIALLGALALAGALQLPGDAFAQQAQGEPYRIGIILPMTGATADYGADFNRGAQLAEEEINAAGGINGRPIKLVLGDSKNSPRDGVAEFRRLVDVDKVPAIISTMTGVIVPQFPLSRETNTPMICVGAITPEIRKGGPTVFSNYPLADDEEKEIAEYIIKKLGHKTAAIIYENSSYGKTLSSIFIDEFKKMGGTILAEEVIEKGGRDFRSQITRIGATNPPVTVTYAYYAEGGLIVRQAAELGVKTQFISHGSIQNNSFAEIAGPAAEGFISGSPSWDLSEPQVQAYLERYRKKYNRESDLYGPYFYDAVKLYAEAIKRGGYSKEGIIKGLKEIKDFQGVVGKMGFDHGNVVLLPLRFVKFTNGKWTLISK
jgi:branched-chain amino acid transport system substrate-binding protein